MCMNNFKVTLTRVNIIKKDNSSFNFKKSTCMPAYIWPWELFISFTWPKQSISQLNTRYKVWHNSIWHNLGFHFYMLSTWLAIFSIKLDSICWINQCNRTETLLRSWFCMAIMNLHSLHFWLSKMLKKRIVMLFLWFSLVCVRVGFEPRELRNKFL
jgi:hypothetical protein